MTDREHRNRELAADLLDRYAHNDHGGILSLLTEDCVFNIGAGKSEGIVPYHGVHTGHEKIAGYLRKRHTNSRRDECIIKRPTPAGTQSLPQSGEKAESARPRQDEFLVHRNTVVAIGRLRDQFADGSHMHESDFVLVLKIDEEQDKISSFHYFLDTAAVAEAWRKKHTSKP